MNVQEYARRRAVDRISLLVERTDVKPAALAEAILRMASPRNSPEDNRVYEQIALAARSRGWLKVMPGSETPERFQGFLIKVKHDNTLMRTTIQ